MDRSDLLDALESLRLVEHFAEADLDAAAPLVRGLTPEQQSQLSRVPEGRLAALLWRGSFARTLLEIEEFSAFLEKSPGEVTVADLERGVKAYERCVEGLKLWLEAQASVPQAS